jgi:hypothetical protein
MLPVIIKDSALDEIQNAYDYLEEIGASTPLRVSTLTPLDARSKIQWSEDVLYLKPT